MQRGSSTHGFNRTHVFSNAGQSSPGIKKKGISFPSVIIIAQCSREEHSIIPPPLCQSHMKPDFYKHETSKFSSQSSKNSVEDKLDSLFLLGWIEISEQWYYSKQQKVQIIKGVFFYEYPLNFLVSSFPLIPLFSFKYNNTAIYLKRVFAIKTFFDHIQFCFLINSLTVAQILRLFTDFAKSPSSL